MADQRRYLTLGQAAKYHADFSIEKITLDQLDWAIAGTSSSWPIGDGGLTHGQWRHWIDSRTTDTENLADEGDNYPQPDGTTLEKGSMVNPATGKDTAYEELWRDVEPLPVKSTHVRYVVLQLDESDQVKGSMVLLGQYCQGLLRRGSDITAERWEWKGGDGWKRTITIGEDELPCSKILKDTLFAVGDIVTVGGDSWKVIEASG